jgi:hypothetical protein
MPNKFESGDVCIVENGWHYVGGEECACQVGHVVTLISAEVFVHERYRDYFWTVEENLYCPRAVARVLRVAERSLRKLTPPGDVAEYDRALSVSNC